MEVVLGGILATMCRFPSKSLLVELCLFLCNCEVQAKGQSQDNLCGPHGLVQKSEFGTQILKT